MRALFIKVLPLCLMLILLFPLSGFAASGNSDFLTPAQFELFNKANELFEKEDYRGIISLLHDQVEKNDKPHPYGCIMYGMAHLRLDNARKAKEIFSKGLKSSPDYAALHLNLGVAYLQVEEYEQAGDCFIKASVLEPQSSSATLYIYSAAQCFYFAQKYSKSLDTVKNVLGHALLKPDWVNLAAVNCMQMNKWGEAEQYLMRLVEMEPGRRQNWKSLAYSRLRLNKHNTAAAALDIAARLPEVSDRDHKELSGMYRHANAPILGLEVEKLLPASQEKEKIYISSLLKANRQDKLIEYVGGLIAKKPAPELYLIKGTAHYRLGELQSAQRAFHAGATIKGKEKERCHLLEGMVAWERRDWKSAKSAFAQLTHEGGRFRNQAGQAISAIEAMEEIEAEIAELERQLASVDEAVESSDNAPQTQNQGYAGL